MAPADYFGPDERFQILADLFEIPLEKAKLLSIEPPFWCDYGTNIKFKGEVRWSGSFAGAGKLMSSQFYCNFNTTVRILFPSPLLLT